MEQAAMDTLGILVVLSGLLIVALIVGWPVARYYFSPKDRTGRVILLGADGSVLHSYRRELEFPEPVQSPITSVVLLRLDTGEEVRPAYFRVLWKDTGKTEGGAAIFYSAVIVEIPRDEA